jgi:hypothetical protein
MPIFDGTEKDPTGKIIHHLPFFKRKAKDFQ